MGSMTVENHCITVHNSEIIATSLHEVGISLDLISDEQ